MSGLYLYCGVFNMTILICDTILKKFEHSKISLSLFFFHLLKLSAKFQPYLPSGSRENRKKLFFYMSNIYFLQTLSDYVYFSLRVFIKKDGMVPECV